MSPKEKETRSLDLVKKIMDNINTTGWTVMAVGWDQETETPSFAYTIGLTLNFNHPELYISGLPPEVAHSLLNSLGRRAKAGEILAEGRQDGLMPNYTGWLCKCRPMDTAELRWIKNVTSAHAEVLQLIWPDKDNKFSWEDGAAQHQQKLLCDVPVIPG